MAASGTTSTLYGRKVARQRKNNKDGNFSSRNSDGQIGSATDDIRHIRHYRPGPGPSSPSPAQAQSNTKIAAQNQLDPNHISYYVQKVFHKLRKP